MAMATMVSIVYDYHKKHGLMYQSAVYRHLFSGDSYIDFTIETAEKEVLLRDPTDGERYSASVLTKKFRVVFKSEKFPTLDWFDGRRFNTIKSAIRAIEKAIPSRLSSYVRRDGR
jgi:hypothetical protein